MLRRCVDMGLVLTLVTAPGVGFAADTSAQEQLARWSAQAGRPGDAARGEQFFNATHANKWSCATCHGKPPVTTGKHASTGKAIKPFAPSANPQAFTDSASVDKWFRRNCKDVLERECTPAEKADVMSYVLSVKP